MAVANTYDNAGNMTGQTRYSNLAETTVVAATSYTYDAANQMTGITDKNSSGTTLVSYGYTYNAAGLVSQETRTWASGADTDTLGYTYTANDQLTAVTHTDHTFVNESFSYDANGNESGTGYTTSTDNEQTASPGYTYTYDADGNMITSTQTSTGDTWTYSYNLRGQMTGAVETNSEDTVLAQVTYTYDALGNRIGVDENGTQTWTLYDGSDPIMDFNSSGSLETRYLNGPTGQLVDTVLARESAGGTIAWYLPDRLGTVRDLINNSGGIIDHVDYSAFGAVLDESAPSEGDRMMGFAGMERDTVNGLNLAVNRVQNPGTGRWTSQDPVGFAAGDANLNRYVQNDPLGHADPSGRDDAGKNGGTITIGPGVFVPPGTEISPEGGGWIPFDPGNIPPNVDALVFPGCNGGLLKIPNYADVTLTGFAPDGEPLYDVTFRTPFTWWPTWWPAGGGNPFNQPIPGYPPPPKAPGRRPARRPRRRSEECTMDDNSHH